MTRKHIYVKKKQKNPTTINCTFEPLNYSAITLTVGQIVGSSPDRVKPDNSIAMCCFRVAHVIKEKEQILVSSESG